ncbi:MAG TPA: muconolactone delta-isomerase [Actinobacteria bacterium]|nr:muconolactone delta-isomerase [Actinomycetota bacterium]
MVAEWTRAGESMAERMITRLGRVPRQRTARGLLRAKDPEELRDAIASLPSFPSFESSIQPPVPRPSDSVGRH